MQKFRSPGGCQRFLSVLSVVRNLFALNRPGIGEDVRFIAFNLRSGSAALHPSRTMSSGVASYALTYFRFL